MPGLALCIMSLWVAAEVGLFPQNLCAAELPAGFKVERYARLLERNPFALEVPIAPPAQPSPLDNLFLAGWLKEGDKEVIFVQNSETNEVQRFTAEPGQNKLRLVEMHLNPNPQLVEAIISDGKEQAGVKFRFEAHSAARQTASGVDQMPNSGGTGWRPNAAELAPKALRNTPDNLPNAQSPGSPTTAPVKQAPRQRVYPGIPRVHSEGGSRQQITLPQGASLKHLLPDSHPHSPNDPSQALCSTITQTGYLDF